jgi:hypothetical protein
VTLTVADIKAGLQDPHLLDLPAGPAGHMLNKLAAFIMHEDAADDAELGLFKCDCADCRTRRALETVAPFEGLKLN